MDLASFQCAMLWSQLPPVSGSGARSKWRCLGTLCPLAGLSVKCPEMALGAAEPSLGHFSIGGSAVRFFP